MIINLAPPLGSATDMVTEVEVVTLENELSPEPNECIPDYLNASYNTLRNLAGLSDQDSLIYE